MSGTDDTLGGGFAEVRGGTQVPLSTRPASLTAAAEAAVNTSTVVVALPAADDPVHGIGPEEKHSTLLWFDVVDDATADAIRAAVQTLAAEVEPSLTADTVGLDALGDDDPQAQVILLAPGGGNVLALVREDLLSDEATRAAWEAVKQWPSFTPHVTLGYGDEVTDEDRTAAAELTQITFDRLAVWQGDRRDEYPLGAAMTASTLSAAAGDPAPTVAPVDAAAGDAAPNVSSDERDDQFYGVATVEDVQTGDGRVFTPNSLEWPTIMPQPLGWQPADAPGHDGALIVGRIDSYERFGNLIAYRGTWDLAGAGWETQRLVEGRFLSGISVDVDDAEATPVNPDGTPVDMWDMMIDGGEDVVLAVTRGRIRSATLCRVPAFIDAFIANGTPPQGWAGERPEVEVEPMAEEEAEPLVAALTAAAPARAPWAPPADWFADPLFTPGDGRLVQQKDGSYACPLTVTADGRVFGHIAAWGTCHIGYPDACVTPPESASAYAHFAKGVVTCADGTVVNVGPLTMDTGHAAASLSAAAAAAHYDDTGSAAAYVAVGQDTFGIWMAGSVAPGVTADRTARLRATGAVSGDWRQIRGSLELVAALVVNTPGFPIQRIAASVAHGEQTALVAAGVVAPRRRHVSSDDLAAMVQATVTATLNRRRRVERAARRIGQDPASRVARAAARIQTRTKEA